MPIHKKRDNGKYKNYRWITILSTVLIIYEKIIKNRLKEIIEIKLDESQSGFRKGRGVCDYIIHNKADNRKEWMKAVLYL